MNVPRTLSALEWDVLWMLSKRGPLKGIAIRQELIDYYGEEVSHAEVYPSLDALADLELVREVATDGRPREYKLTEEGRRTLARRQIWQEGLSSSNNGP
ncbi:PadR family transcriptional regulator [Halorarum halobium]|uniref:PadR family transcriptional regulator n=1 Tax=Halorarum halobium TaxID=3075121 RepID=UPI0028B033F2|nr:helix-turn-helix transcriptional regulator [Halobaculum sp. XH14]